MTVIQLFRAAIRMACLGGALCFAHIALAQHSEQGPETPLDDITLRLTVEEHRILPYSSVREADILWEQRLWRVIDTREKMNHSFVSPEAPLFQVLQDAIETDQITAYSTSDDKFTTPLHRDEVNALLHKQDTVVVVNFDTGLEEVHLVNNDINWEDVKRFRIKEVWYFDTKTSTLRVRILGIAPLLNVLDDDGNFRFEKPLFWVHYPSARPVLARHKVVMPHNNLAAITTWESLFEMRHFSSMVYKENNQYDRRLEDYLAGADILLESRKINDALFNREHDLWQQ